MDVYGLKKMKGNKGVTEQLNIYNSSSTMEKEVTNLPEMLLNKNLIKLMKWRKLY